MQGGRKMPIELTEGTGRGGGGVKMKNGLGKLVLFEESSFRSDYWEIAETAYTLDHLIRPVHMFQSSGSLGATAHTGRKRWLNTTRAPPPLNASPVLSWSAFPGRVYALFKHWADVSRPEEREREKAVC